MKTLTQIKPVFLSFMGLFAACFTLAQNTIPNAGFENWTTSGNYEDPDGWFTPNQGTSLAGVETVTKTSDAHSGSYAIRLETKNVNTETIPGTAVAGVVNLTSLQVDPGFAVSSNPITLDGWYKYQPFIVDVGSVEILLSKWNPTLKVREPVGSGIFVQPLTISTYTSFSIDIIYVSSDTADTAIITLLSGSYTNPPGSVLFVDDLSFTFPPPLPVSVKDYEESIDIVVYPNPASDYIYIAALNSDVAFFKMRDMQGRLIRTMPVHSQHIEVDLKSIGKGQYVYTLLNPSGNTIQRGTFLVGN